ncbi:MAG: YncE family protein [Gemmatimonadota bacterium]
MPAPAGDSRRSARPPRSALFAAAALAALAGTLAARQGPPTPRAEAAPRAYLAYVAAESDDEVDVARFDGERLVVLRRIPVGRYEGEIDGPHGIAIDAARGRWYVSIAHGRPFGFVQAFATGTDEPLGQAEVGLFPATMSVAPDGHLFVANFNLHGDPVPGFVSVVATDALSEIAAVETCEKPHGSRVSPDGGAHYSVCVGDDQLVEIGTRDLRVRRRLSLAPGRERGLPPEAVRNPGADGGDRCAPTWVQPDPSGRRLYVACNALGRVLEVEVGDWRIARRFETGAGPYNLDVTPDGRRLVVTVKGEARVGVWDLASGREVATVPSSRRLPHGVAISDDSRYAFVSVEGVGSEPGALDVIDLDAGRRVASADVGRQAGGIGVLRADG